MGRQNNLLLMKLLIKYHADFYPIRAAALSNAASRAANVNVLTSSFEEVSKQLGDRGPGADVGLLAGGSKSLVVIMSFYTCVVLLP